MSIASGGFLSTKNWAVDRPSDDGRYDTGNVILHKAENDFKAAGRNIFAKKPLLNTEKLKRGWDVNMDMGWLFKRSITFSIMSEESEKTFKKFNGTGVAKVGNPRVFFDIAIDKAYVPFLII